MLSRATIPALMPTPSALRLVPFVLALALTLTACSKTATAPLEESPPSGDGPRIVVSVPAARSEGVVYDTEIWAGFDRALEASSVDSTSVFLKLDTQRIPCTITYESAPRRVRLRPRATLQLQRTYTVEFAAHLRATDGTTLGTRTFFQFKTNSLRRPTYSYPDSLAREGPLVTLGWGGNGGASSQYIHELYAGTDSAAVANRTIPPLQRGTALLHMPLESWPRGARIHWSVTTENVATGERLAGHLRAFDTFPEGWPVDSVSWTMFDYGGSRFQTPRLQYCQSTTQFTGPGHSLATHFRNHPAAVTGAAIESVRLYLPLQAGYADSLASNPLTVWSTTTDFTACSFGWPGPPFPDPNGLLGTAEACGTPSTALVRNARLAAWFEQNVRARGVPGIQYVAGRTIGTAFTGSVPATAVVVYLRRNAAPAPAAAAER